MERLQKIIAHTGYCSRRKAEELIIAGRVKVNGIVVTELGIVNEVRFLAPKTAYFEIVSVAHSLTVNVATFDDWNAPSPMETSFPSRLIVVALQS